MVPQDRFEPRIDQGERIFRIWVKGGKTSDRLLQVDREAQIKNEAPVVLSCSPSGNGKKPDTGTVEDDKTDKTAESETEDASDDEITISDETEETEEKQPEFEEIPDGEEKPEENKAKERRMMNSLFGTGAVILGAFVLLWIYMAVIESISAVSLPSAVVLFCFTAVAGIITVVFKEVAFLRQFSTTENIR